MKTPPGGQPPPDGDAPDNLIDPAANIPAAIVEERAKTLAEIGSMIDDWGRTVEGYAATGIDERQRWMLTNARLPMMRKLSDTCREDQPPGAWMFGGAEFGRQLEALADRLDEINDRATKLIDGGGE
jgi:hypothetical protein